MTVCPDGSEPKPGAPVLLHIEPSAYMTYLPPALQWLSPFAPYLPPVDIDFSTFCTFEPPSTELITADDLFNLLRPNNYQLAFLAGEKIAAWVHLYLWYQWCQCIDASTPAAPDPPTSPAGAPVINPLGTMSEMVCLFATTDRAPFNGSYIDLIGRHPVPLYTDDPATGPGMPLPAGADGGEWSIDLSGSGIYPGTHIDVRLNFYDDTPALIYPGSTVLSAVVPDTYTSAISIPTGATQFCFLLGGPLFEGDTDGWSPDAYVKITCSGTTPRVSGCCPQDAGLRGLLEQVASAVGSMNELVTLIQRQAVPFGRIDGASHSGLTGHGTITIADLLGVRIEITAIPAHSGRLGSDPEFLWDLGSVSWGGTDGYSPREVIHTTPQLSLPNLAGQYTRLTYSLEPGVTATIVELEREAS